MSMVRRSLQVVAFLCTLVVGATSMAVIVTQTTWFREWLRGFIVRQADDYVNGQLSIGRIDGNLFFGVRLADVGVTVDGKTVVGIDDIGVDYNAFTFIKGDVVLDDIRLTRPVVRLGRTADGRLNLADLIRARTPDPDEPKNRRTIEIGEIGVSDGTLFVEPGVVGTSGVSVPLKVEGLDASLGVKSNEDELVVDIAHLSLRATEPALDINSLSGVVRRTENTVHLDNLSLRTDESSMRVNGTIGGIEGGAPVFDVNISSDKLAMNEIGRLVPALRRYALQPAFEIRASGPADRLAVQLNARDARVGKAVGDLTIDALDPERRVTGTVSLDRFNLAPLVPSATPVKGGTGVGRESPALKSDITGRARIDFLMPTDRAPLRGTYAVNASHVSIAGYEARDVVARGRIDGETIRLDASAAAYGGRATAAGTITTARTLSLDLHGQVAGVDLRSLPPSLDVPSVPSDIQSAYTLSARGSQFSGTFALETSTIAGATLASGTTGTFAVGQGAPEYSAKGQVSDLDLQQIGEHFAIDALAMERYHSRINAYFDVSGSGGGRYPLVLDAAGTVVDSSLFGASFPKLDFTTKLADGDAYVTALGRFEQLDPAVVSGNERAAGMLAGSVDVQTIMRGYADGVTVDSIDLAGRVTLEPSTIGAIAIEKADVEGQYAQREGMVKVAVTGADVNISGEGPISLTDTGSTDLTLHIETPALDEVGKIVGQPLKGAAMIDAKVTGNARKLDVKGTLKGSDIGHGEDEALSLTSNFDVTVPDLTPQDATVRASNMVSFLEVAGQKVTELAADVTYHQSKLDFQAMAQEGMRELEAGGTVLFHPDRQEIVLSSLALRAEQLEWRTPSDAEARVQYTKERIAIEGLTLVSGDQRIAADGVFGSETEPLRVRVGNVDVSEIDRLLLGDQRISGRLAADANVTGPMNAPRVQGDFSLTQGAFREYKFESLSGKVGFTKPELNVDVRLQQTAAEWLTVKGTAPLTLFEMERTERGDVHREATPGDTVDLEVKSSQVNLALIQGFTSAVTNVTGTLEANVKVTGSGHDPHMAGAIDIRGGSFAVPELGTRYSGLDTRVNLTPTGLSIDRFKILDARGFPMTVGGTLALHALSVGAVDIKLESSKFEVIDNKLADLKLNTDLQITGEVRRPQVRGFIEIENATINVAELLDRFGADPYATEEAPAPDAAAPPASDAAEEPTPGLFDALDADVSLSVPSNLVLRGNGIEAPNAPVSLGDVNITVGGVLQVKKVPGGRLRINGDVNTVRGVYMFQGRRFEIVRDGRIGFSGSEEIDPLLDLTARREISGVEAFIHVRGTMKRPELTFSSNPPQEQADILSLIIFNQPVNQLGEGEQQSLTERAGMLAGGYLTSGLSRSIANALELDEFEIQAQGENGSGPSLTVGEQIGRRLFFRLRQAFGSTQTTEVILEYQIREYLRAQSSFAQGDTSQSVQFRRVEHAGLDLIFFFSY